VTKHNDKKINAMHFTYARFNKKTILVLLIITTKISSDLVVNPQTLNILPLAESKETHNLFQALNTNSIPKYKI